MFRDDRGELLTEPYPVSFLTSAAPNLSAIRSNQPCHQRLVLGAWGCGVFGDDSATVAEAFAAALAEHPMAHVVFAVLGRNRDAFTAAFPTDAR